MNEPIALTITLLPGGKVNVNGPIQNKLLCYGLLGIAHEMVSKQEDPSLIVAPDGAFKL